ncbi:MAG: hypothetical protein PUB98_07140 [Clostridiales bacterium]|nr:hypothetical protein [Clostridiales bacterium]
MKSASVFLVTMYLYLLFCIGIVIWVVRYLVGNDAGGEGAFFGLLFVLCLGMIGVLHLCGWVCVILSAVAYNRGRWEKLRRGWRLLKLGSIPFFLLNFLLSAAVWFVLIGATRGLYAFLVPIPIFLTCILIVQSGIVGILYLLSLRRQEEKDKRPSGVHYVLQLMPVLDVISTLILLRRYRTHAPSTGG